MKLVLGVFLVSASIVYAHPELDPRPYLEGERSPSSQIPVDLNESELDLDTPIKLDEIAGDVDLTNSRPWRAPKYENQQGTLGYDVNSFSVPKGLEAAVGFWKDIYAKYSTDQGVIHDSENIDLVYAVVDFSDISRRNDLDRFQKERRKIKRVNDTKQSVIDKIRSFKSLSSLDGLSADDKKIYDRLKAGGGKEPFEAATKKNRLRFQLGQRDRIVQGIFFSGRYLEDFEAIFKEAGLPIELTRMVFVESSFNILARSKVGASGLWQIMPYTTKGFFKKSEAYDLRNHPIEATKLAAKLLRNNYRLLESWPLAVTGYNHGPFGIKKLTEKYKTRELGELVANVEGKKRFGFASTNFYASFLAILELEKDAPKYFGPVVWSQKLPATEIVSEVELTYSDLLRWFNDQDQVAQVFNPHISSKARKGHLNIPKKISIFVPTVKADVVKKEVSSMESLKVARAENRESRKTEQP